MSNLKVRVDVSKFRKIADNYRKKVDSNEFSNIVHNHIKKVSKGLQDQIRNNLIKDNEMPKSFQFSTRKKPLDIKFKLPKRLSFPRNRTGNLRKSIKVKLGKRTTLLGLKTYKKLYITAYVEIDDKNKYGRILETGGIIRPKKVRNLAIPIDKESFKKSPRDFDNLRLFKNKILAKRVSRYFYKPLFLLLKKVKIKGFHYISRSKKEFLNSSKYKNILKSLEKSLIKSINSK